MAKVEKEKKEKKHFFKDFKAELKKVIWPTRSQVINNTIIVIVIVLIVTAIVFVLDFAFEALNTYGINRLKQTVQNSVVTENKDDNADGENKDNDAENNSENNEEDNNQEDTDGNQENNNAEGENVNDTSNVTNTAE